jgi:dolichyl-diphosphooligosaccharide---protein glycosyltransferase
MKKGNK